MPLPPDDPIIRARREVENAHDMNQEALALLLEAIAALSPAYALDESWKTRRARARARLLELADLLPTTHRMMSGTITILYAAERKHEGTLRIPPK